jgi:DNA polymerase I-like protein with 3'-5' exonuclease and polymerase domains
MERINTENVKTIWFNAPFDIRFIKHTLGVLLTPYWDASIAARILNSNEPRGSRGLKPLHKKYCNHGKGDAFSFDKLFEGIPFDLIPINTAYLYAANDAVITYELYKFQEYYLDPNYEGYKTHHMEGPSNVFFNIEMKSMPVFIEMEENGVTIDIEYAKTISEKYRGRSRCEYCQTDDFGDPDAAVAQGYGTGGVQLLAAVSVLWNVSCLLVSGLVRGCYAEVRRRQLR